MKLPLIWFPVVLIGAWTASAPASPMFGETVDLLHLAGNTSSNSSSNTSSNSSAGGSSIVHTHKWSVDSDDGKRRRSVGGVTRIERYAPERPRYRYRDRRDWDD